MEQLVQIFKRDWLLWLSAILSLGGYILLLLWFPLRPFFNQAPLHDIYSLAPSMGEAARYAGLIVLLYALYLIAYKLVISRRTSLSIWAILSMAALFAVPLLVTFPINATDVYRYFIRGRINSVHLQDPFSIAVTTLENEPFAVLAGEWASETSPYGPIWEIIASSVTSIAPDNLWLNLLLFKGLAAITFLLVGGLIWLALDDRNGQLRRGLTLLWLWNPSILLIFAVGGHNDGLMLVWLLLGWLIMKHGRIQIGMVVMILAPLTKPIGLLTLPFFFIYGWRHLADRRAKFRYIILTFLAVIALVWLSFLPFGSPVDLARRLLNEASSAGGFSPLALIIMELRARNFNPPLALSTRITTILFALLGLWLLWKSWWGRSPLRTTVDVFAGYIIQAFRFRIWYTVWPFPWMLLDQESENGKSLLLDSRQAAGIAFLFSSQLSVLIYGHLRIELFGRSHLRAHRLGVFFTFGFPLLVAAAVAFYNARLRAPRRGK